jgi:THO complex subunit 2
LAIGKAPISFYHLRSNILPLSQINPSPSRPADDEALLLDLTRVVRSGKLQAAKVTDALKLAGITEQSPALETSLADALWFAWLECSSGNDINDSASEPLKSRLADCAKELMKTRWISKRVLMEVSEGDFLEWAGLIVSYKDGFRKKEIRSNTKHVYTQRKYNLLREESEGYSKLVTLLNQVGAGALTPGPRVDAAVDEIKSLIGYFDLDPNRTCSLVLDAFTVQPRNDSFLELITKLFSADAVSQLLGFHFSAGSVVSGKQAVEKEKEEKVAEESTISESQVLALPRGLYTAAAKLINANIVQLNALLGHLSPSKDGEIAAAWKQGQVDLETAVKRIGVISLTSGTEGAIDNEQQEQQRRRAGQSAAALDLDPKPLAANLINSGKGALEQRTLLLAALLRVPGAWEHAVQLILWLSALGVHDIAVFPDVGKALCALLAAEIAPQYERLHPGGKAQQLVTAGCTSIIDSTTTAASGDYTISDHAIELLQLIGHHLYHDVATLTRIARLSGAVLSINNTDARAVEILGSYVMPAAALIPGNVALSLEVWSALSKLPYTQRFCLYGQVRDAAEKSPLLRASAKLAETEVRRILRRVTAPANRREAKLTMRPLGRMLAKITHANPLAVAEQLLRQVMGMPGMVASISEALKYLIPLAFDVLTFAILCQLASRRRKLKEDGINLEEWFQWLAAFTGILARKHESVEVTALAQYIANQLKGCESLDILVLWELIATMTGVAPVFEVSDGQLDALSGSETLIGQIIVAQLGEQSKSGNERAAARGMHRLLRALSVGSENDQLVMPLLILLAQQRKLITLQSQVSHLKLVAELYDRCQEVTVQYAEFLRKALPLSEYAARLPSITDLAIEYSIDPEIIFELHRPLIRGTMPPPAPVEEEAEEGEAAAAAAETDVIKEEEEEGAVATAAGEAAAGAAAAGGGFSPEPREAADDDEEGEINGGDDVSAMDVEDGEVPVTVGAGNAGISADTAAALTAAAAALPGASMNIPLLSWDELVEQTAVLAPEGGFRGMPQTLFVTFWALALYDLDVPAARYSATLTQVRSAARAARDDLEAARRDAQRPSYGGGNMRQGGGGHGGHPAAQPPQQVADMEGLAREVERLEAIAAKLPVDLKEQEANAAAVDARLKLTRGAW